MPKLQTSCSTVCTKVWSCTLSADVVEARAGVFEFLSSTTADCTVCDKAASVPSGFSYESGRGEPDEFPRRTFDGEGVEADVDFGPTSC